jgi:hypothetical protein
MRSLLLGGLVATGASAAPGSKLVKECVAASERAQIARDELRFSEARRALLGCAQASCPAVVQADCAKWLTQLDADQPTVVLVVRQGDKDVTDPVTVQVDGVEVELKPGQALPVDPGARRITVTLGDGRAANEAIVAAVGERNRRLSFQLPAPPAPAAQAAVSRPVLTEPVATVAARPSPLVPALLSVGAVAGAVVFTSFGLLGNGALAPVQQAPCAATRSCDPMAVAPARALYLVADLGLIVGVAFAAMATWRWLAWAMD